MGSRQENEAGDQTRQQRLALRLDAARRDLERAIRKAHTAGMAAAEIALATGLDMEAVARVISEWDSSPTGRLTVGRAVLSTAALERVSPDCREFAEAVEDLLQRRRLAGTHPSSCPATEWSRDELCDLAYSSYKALLRGIVRRPPRRDVVLRVADYLACSPAERNRLLVSASYSAEPADPSGHELERALNAVRSVVDGLPLPAYVVARDWTVLHLNDSLLALLRLSRAEWEAIPRTARTVLQLLFDPGLPVRPRLGGDTDGWDRLARSAILFFKLDNQPYRHSVWYGALVDKLRRLPGFGERWDVVAADDPSTAVNGLTPDPFAAVLSVADANGAPVWLRPMNAYLHRSGYPGIVMLVPIEP